MFYKDNVILLLNGKDKYTKFGVENIMIKKRKIVIIAFILLGIFYFTGCGTDKKEAIQKTPEDISLSYNIAKLGSEHYKINIDSNLPDGFQLMIELTNQARLVKEMNLTEEAENMTDKQVEIYTKALCRASARCSMKDGKAAIELKNMKPDDYIIYISSSVMRSQNDKIKKMFGINGELLHGKYVDDGEMGKNISLIQPLRIE